MATLRRLFRLVRPSGRHCLRRFYTHQPPSMPPVYGAMGALSFDPNHPGIVPNFHATTILSLRRGGKVVMVGDGQMSQNNVVVKAGVNKIFELNAGKVLVGVSGSVADACILVQKFEDFMESLYEADLMDVCLRVGEQWRTQKYLQRLNASIIAIDGKNSIEINGDGTVINHHSEVDSAGLMGVGSGSLFAVASARALLKHNPEMSAVEIAKRSMKIASEMCVFTNDQFVIRVLNDECGTTSEGDLPEKDEEAAEEEK